MSGSQDIGPGSVAGLGFTGPGSSRLICTRPTFLVTGRIVDTVTFGPAVTGVEPGKAALHEAPGQSAGRSGIIKPGANARLRQAIRARHKPLGLFRSSETPPDCSILGG